MSPDLINGSFEFLGSIAILKNILILKRDKELKGQSALSCIFFLSWGYWNLGYYPGLNQIWSTCGAICLAFLNTIWVAMLAYYNFQKHKSKNKKI